MSAKLTPYQRIIRAADAKKGVRLSADEVRKLSNDDAIAKRAAWDDSPEDEDIQRAIDTGRAQAAAERKGE